MQIRIIYLILLNLTLLFAQSPLNEVGYISDRSNNKIPYLNHILIQPYPCVINQNKYKVYFLVDVMYDFLQFVKEEDFYSASFQIEVNLRNEETKESHKILWKSSLSVYSFSETNRRDKYHFSVDSIEITPGEYNIQIEYQDLQGKQNNISNLKLFLKPITGMYVAKPLFLVINDNHQSYGILPGRPLVLQNNIPFNLPLKLFLYSYISDRKNMSINFKIIPEGFIDPIFHLDTTITVDNLKAYNTFSVPFIKFKEGRYILKSKYIAGRDSIEHSVTFNIIWFNKPRSLRYIEYSIRPLEVIISEEEFKQINSGNQQEKQKKFEEFWDKKDPTPETAFNEVFYEFYSRVDSVDLVWGGKRRYNGWSTDPGRIYLMYGQPDKIEDQSLNPISPYLKWIYYRPDHYKIFIFKALDGRKRYKLISEEEEEFEKN